MIERVTNVLGELSPICGFLNAVQVGVPVREVIVFANWTKIVNTLNTLHVK